MKAKSFAELRKNAGLGDVHVPGGGGGRRARSFKELHEAKKARTFAELYKGYNEDQPRDERGRWVSGGSVLAEFSSKSTATGTLNGVPFSSWDAPNTLREWANVEGQNPDIKEPPFEAVEGKHNGAGVIIREPDGRVWMVKPSNGYGGYKGTFPKGTQDEGLSMQATAIKEAWEESGLKVRITGFAADVERDTSKARYYFAERVGGTPSDHGPESEGVVLVPPARAHEILNRAVDRKLAHEVIGAPKPPPEAKPKAPTGWHQGGFEDTWGIKAPQYGSKGSTKAMQAAVEAGFSAAGKPPAGKGGKPPTGLFKPPGGAPKGTGYTSVFDLKPKLKKAATFADLVGLAKPVAKSFDYVRKTEAIAGNLCRGPDGKFVPCGIGGMAPSKKPKLKATAEAQAASDNMHKKVVEFASSAGLPAPSKPLGSPSNMGGHAKASALIQAAKDNDLATLKSFVAKNENAKQSYTKAQVEYAKALIKAKEGETAAAVAATKADPPPQTTASGLKSTAGWKKVGAQLGSNPGGVYEDESGQKWYVKQSKSDDHARAEHLAGKLYELAGSPTTNPELVDVGGGKLGIATKWVEKGAFNKNNAGHVLAARADFAVHAWTANHDAVGLSFDNQAVIPHPTKGVTMATVDVGGSLMYRAKGELKTEFGTEVKEWNTMRMFGTAPQASAVFGAMTKGELTVAAGKVAAIKDEDIFNTVLKHGPGTEAERFALADKMIARKNHIAKLGGLVPSSASPVADVPKPAPVVKPVAPIIAKPPRIPKEVKQQQAPAIPAKPDPSIFGSAANAPNKKLIAATDAMHAAAVKYANGEMTKDQAVAYISSYQFGSQSFHKKAAKFQGELLAAVGGAGKPTIAAPSPAAMAAAAAKAGKSQFDAAKISTPPSFKNWGGSGKGGPSSVQALNDANDKAVQAIYSAAKFGDPSLVKSLMVDVVDKNTGKVTGQQSVLDHPSQWVKGYATQVMQEIDYIKNPPKQFRFTGDHPIKSLSAAYPAVSDIKSVNASKKLGNYVVLGTPGTITPESFGITPQKPNKAALSAAFQQAWSKIPETQKQAIVSYTGNAYKTMNQSLWEGNPTGKAKAAAEAIQTHGHEIAPGTILSRKITFENASDAAKLKPGLLLQEPAISSTSIKPSVWGGAVHYKMTVGPGVKGLYVESKSIHGIEAEMVLPPNTRMLITKVEPNSGVDKDGFGGGGKTLVHVLLLPNEKGL